MGGLEAFDLLFHAPWDNSYRASYRDDQLAYLSLAHLGGVASRPLAASVSKSTLRNVEVKVTWHGCGQHRLKGHCIAPKSRSQGLQQLYRCVDSIYEGSQSLEVFVVVQLLERHQPCQALIALEADTPIIFIQ